MNSRSVADQDENDRQSGIMATAHGFGSSSRASSSAVTGRATGSSFHNDNSISPQRHTRASSVPSSASQRRRRRRPSQQHRSTPGRHQHQRRSASAPHAPHPPHQPQPQDQNRSLLWEAIKATLGYATGITLHTTSALLTPPLNATRTLLLPEINDAIQAYYHTLTPERVQAWVRVLTSLLTNIIHVVGKTTRGRDLGEKVQQCTMSGMEVLSSNEVRQVLVDKMAAVVKTAEAMRTPEFKEMLEHSAVVGCRVVDALSTGHVKQLLHDVSDTVWSAIELAADPTTTVAMAEITANLCHALESEENLYQPQHRHAASHQRRAKRRRARDRRIAKTYTSCDTTTTVSALLVAGGGEEEGDDVVMGIEDVIMSSLGDGSHLMRHRVPTAATPAAADGNAGDTVLEGEEGLTSIGGGNDVDEDDDAAANNSLPMVVNANVEANKFADSTQGRSQNTVKGVNDNDEDFVAAMDAISSIGEEDDDGADLTEASVPDPYPGGRGDDAGVVVPDSVMDNNSAACDLQYLRECVTARAETMQVSSKLARRSCGVGNSVNEPDITPKARGGTNSDNALATKMNDAQSPGRQDGMESDALPNREEDIEDLTSMQDSEGRIEDEHLSEKSKDTSQAKRGVGTNIKYEQLEDGNEGMAPSQPQSKLEQNRNGEHFIDRAEDFPGGKLPASQLFISTFESSMSSRRREGIGSVLNSDTVGQSGNEPQTEIGDRLNDDGSGRLTRLIKSWFPMASAAAGAGNERGQDTLKQRAADSQNQHRHGTLYRRAGIGVGSDVRNDRARSSAAPAEAALERYVLCFGVLLCGGIFAFVVWFIMGCYGFYLLFLAEKPSSPEVIVKVIREVVHVMPDGSILDNVNGVSGERIVASVAGGVEQLANAAVAAAAGAIADAEL